MIKESLDIYESIAVMMSKYHKKKCFTISDIERLAYQGEDGLLEQFIIEEFIESKEKDELLDGFELIFSFNEETCEYVLPRKLFHFCLSVDIVFQQGHPHINAFSREFTTFTRLRNIVELNKALYFDSDCLIEYLYENQIGEETSQKHFNTPWRIDYFDIYDNNQILPVDKVKSTLFCKFMTHPEVSFLSFNENELTAIKNCINLLVDDLKHYPD